MWLPLLLAGEHFFWLVFMGLGQRKSCPDYEEPLSPLQDPRKKPKRQ
jgi:hypothetical protein